VIEAQKTTSNQLIKELKDSGLIVDPYDPIALAKKAKDDANPRKKMSLKKGFANLIKKQPSETVAPITEVAPPSPMKKKNSLSRKSTLGDKKVEEVKVPENPMPLGMGYTDN